MALGFKPGGLFGQVPITMQGILPGDQPDYLPPRPQMTPEAPKKGGIFAPGGVGRNIAGAIGDALLQMNRMEPIFAPQMQYRQAMAARQQQAERERMARRDDYAWERNYDLAHPKPVNNDTVADYNFIKQNLGDAAAAEFLKNKANPPQYRQGPDGNFYRVDTGGTAPQTQSLGTSLPQGWTIEGGPTPQASGPFPR